MVARYFVKMLCSIYKHCLYLTAPFVQSLVRLFKIKLLNITKAWKLYIQRIMNDKIWCNLTYWDIHACIVLDFAIVNRLLLYRTSFCYNDFFFVWVFSAIFVFTFFIKCGSSFIGGDIIKERGVISSEFNWCVISSNPFVYWVT